MKGKQIIIEDDTLREGLQSLSRFGIRFQERLDYLKGLDEIGIEHAIIGLMINEANEDALLIKLFEEVRKTCNLTPWILCRSLKIDADYIGKLYKDNFGQYFPINLSLFRSIKDLSFSEIDDLCLELEKITTSVLGRGGECAFSLEDASRTNEEKILYFLNKINKEKFYCIYLCDSVGRMTPSETFHFVSQIKKKAFEGSRELLGWHGHNDLGLALANSIAAYEAGAEVISGTFLGLGERAGNCPLEQLLMVIERDGEGRYSLNKVFDHCKKTIEIFDYKIESCRPLMGEQVHKTSLGLHQNILLSEKKCRDDYSAISPLIYGMEMKLEISRSSGRKAILRLLNACGIDIDNTDLVNFKTYIYEKNLIFSSEKISDVYREYKNGQ